jgi:hypothetical protein
MNNVNNAIFIRLGNRARKFKEDMHTPAIGKLGRIMLHNIQAHNVDSLGCVLSGLPDHPIRDITMENIHISFKGGVSADAAPADIPELPQKYPEYKMFGVLPAYGFYCRHISGLNMKNVTCRLLRPDVRPALIVKDAVDVDLTEFDADAPTRSPLILLDQVRDADISANNAPEGLDTFIEVRGDRSENINVRGNDMHRVDMVVEIGEGADGSAVFIRDNKF